VEALAQTREFLSTMTEKDFSDFKKTAVDKVENSLRKMEQAKNVFGTQGSEICFQRFWFNKNQEVLVEVRKTNLKSTIEAFETTFMKPSTVRKVEMHLVPQSGVEQYTQQVEEYLKTDSKLELVSNVHEIHLRSGISKALF
jgi:hypothetical protein